MRLLFLNQFYPPDVAPTGQVLHDLARTMARRGHEVQVLCSARSYEGGQRFQAREVLEGVSVRRLPALGFGRGRGRLLDYGSFYALALMSLLRQPRRIDLVMALSTPPYVGLLATLLGRLAGSVQAHWVMDVYPEVLAAHREGRRLPGLGALRRLTRAQLSRAALVLTPGSAVEATLRPYVGTARLETVPLWGEEMAAEPREAERLRRQRGWRAGELVLMYSGNMGLGHSFEEFLQAAARLGVGGPLWAFAGGGRRRHQIEGFAAAHPQARIELLPYVSRELLPASLASADVHLVSLRRQWQGVIVPSKLPAVFSAGRPAIFVGPPGNDIARWIAESGGGWRVEQGDVPGLLRAVEEASDASERARRGEAARAYARLHFDQRRNSTRIAELLEQCVASHGPGRRPPA